MHWLRAEGHAPTVVELPVPPAEALPLDCHRCARLRRQALCEEALRQSCQVLALGHHADDLAVTTLMNVLQHGRVETMPPVRDYFDGRLRLIRPLVLVPEAELARLAQAAGFPPPPAACPRAGMSRRELARELLQRAQSGFRDARGHLLRLGLSEAAAAEPTAGNDAGA
jgi:tRNA(Ile)-lysidine synthase TilS/MesJ